MSLDNSFGQTVKNFYSEHKVLCWIIASAVLIVVVAIVVFIVLRKKSNSTDSTDNKEQFNYSLGTNTDKFTYANSFIQSVLGKSSNVTV